MEKAKPSKKKAYYKNRKPDTSESVSNKYVDWRQVGKKGHRQAENSGTEISNEEVSSPEQREYFSKRPLQQPKSRLGDLDEIWQETHVGQDFEILVNAPMSAGSFVFKSEKNWTLDSSKYNEFFSVDVKNLADIISCIPFNRLVELDDKYFTKDELTLINNTAEQAKRAYDSTLKSLRKEQLERESLASRLSEENNSSSNTDQSLQSTRSADEANPDSKTIEEDLDFLLSLREPVTTHSVVVNVAPPTKTGPDELKAKSIPAATKSIDLEKWLDSVLED